MKIKQVFNNNVVLSENEKGEEIILMGRGIAFGLTKGSAVENERIEKKFKLQEGSGQKFKTLIKDVPYEYILISEEIVDFVKTKSTKRVNDSIYITLADHIANMVERIQMGVAFDSSLLLNIKSLYREEYKFGLEAIEIMKKHLDIKIDESEASFVALHIVNAELDSNMQQIYVITAVIDDIINLISEEFEIDPINNVQYDRFMIHCRFFAQRVLNKESLSDKAVDNQLTYQMIGNSHPRQRDCIQRICEFIEQKYTYKVSIDEELYIMLHLIKLTD